MMTLKYPEPAIHEHSGGALFTLSPQGDPGVLPATHQHLMRLRAMIRQRLNGGPVIITCHPHRVGLSSCVAVTVEDRLRRVVNILITVSGQTSWPQEEEYAHPRWYITVPDSADLVYLLLWINGLDV
nr:acetyltransferase [Escherichia coli]